MIEGGPPSSPEGVHSEPAKRKKLRKEEIVAEATRLFAERGYEGTSMGDLAERVGLRKASLFHHFESKDALYGAVLSELLAGVKIAIASSVASPGTFAERLDALSDAVTRMLGEQPHAARLLIREAMDWGPVMRDQLADQIQEVLEAAVAFTRAGQQEKVFRADLDAPHIVVSTIGIYFIPFVIDRTVERLVGASPYGTPFIEARRRNVNEQVRALVLAQR